MRLFNFVALFLMCSVFCVAQENSNAKTTGVYYNDIKMSYSRITGKKVGNVLGAYVTAGISAAKVRMTVEGKKADLVIKEDKPKFMFVFGREDVSTGFVFTNESNLNNFLLVKMKTSGKGRTIIVGKYGITQIKGNIDTKDIVDVKIERIGDGVYSVVPQDNLEDKTEYGFYYRNAKSKDDSEDIREFKGIYDFRVELEKK